MKNEILVFALWVAAARDNLSQQRWILWVLFFYKFQISLRGNFGSVVPKEYFLSNFITGTLSPSPAKVHKQNLLINSLKCF